MRSIFHLSLILLIFSFTPASSNAQVTSPCLGGFAGAYPCDNYDLVGILDLSGLGGLGGANDIWGWTDPVDGTEYALVGLSGGTAFVDISNPTSPVLIGTLPTASSSTTWRDVKVYADHAFIVSEASDHGMQVFDLTQLGGVASPPVNFVADALYTGFGSAHNIVINEASGYAYGVGARVFGGGAFSYEGGLHFVDISNPTSPVLAGGFDDDGYTHDAQVVNYIGPDPDHAGSEIAFASNEDSFTIVDVTDKTDPTEISRNIYSGSEYTHQGWATEDHRFYLMNDELDENFNGHNTRTYIWNIENLDSPTFLGFYDSANSAIDHNLYIKGDLAFESNYSSGLRVLDISDVANGNLSEVGFFDVYPANDNTSFNGSWSNYPYFASGNIIVTSQSGGLFIVRESEVIPVHCSNGVQDADETGVDCGGADCPVCPCPSFTIYLPSTVTGPALIVCDTDPAPTGYVAAGNQACAQQVVDGDPFCLDNEWDQICQDAYDLCVGTDVCGVFATAPVDLTKSLQPVPFPSGDIDRVQLKFYKSSPAVKYSGADDAALDIEFWPIRDLSTNTPIVNGPVTLLADKTKPGQDFFKWPVKFIRPDIDPNIRYAWRLRVKCQSGDLTVSPWSAQKIFNTPDFDPVTGIYTPPPGQVLDQQAKGIDQDLNQNEVDIYPNPGNGNSLNIRLENPSSSVIVKIFDLSGKLLYSNDIGLRSSDLLIELTDINIWDTGLYVISVETPLHTTRRIWTVSTNE